MPRRKHLYKEYRGHKIYQHAVAEGMTKGGGAHKFRVWFTIDNSSYRYAHPSDVYKSIDRKKK